jgi:hypothetical protein
MKCGCTIGAEGPATPIWCYATLSTPPLCATCAWALVKLLIANQAAVDFMDEVRRNTLLKISPAAGSA